MLPTLHKTTKSHKEVNRIDFPAAPSPRLSDKGRCHKLSGHSEQIKPLTAGMQWKRGGIKNTPVVSVAVAVVSYTLQLFAVIRPTSNVSDMQAKNVRRRLRSHVPLVSRWLLWTLAALHNSLYLALCSQPSVEKEITNSEDLVGLFRRRPNQVGLGRRSQYMLAARLNGDIGDITKSWFTVLLVQAKSYK